MMRQIRKIKDIGQRDKKIKFQRYAGVSDGAAGKRAAWADLQPTATRWAHIKNAPGNKLIVVANRMMWVKAVIFDIEYDENIHSVPTSNLRIIYPESGDRQRAYKIMGMDKVGDNRFSLEIICNGNEVETV